MKRPKVGVGVCIIKNGKVLMSKRKNAHGEGCWSFPGGHLEFGESIAGCAVRETGEETGVTIKNIRDWVYTNDIFEAEDKHYITIYVIADHESGEPQILEPEKCEGWEWFEWENLPSPLFLPLRNVLKAGHNPFA
ncbi:TPA: DNA mismatch repair protein MutT [Candidatus Uhrbacteria bacterium]|nr:DNA mismatch repair protein MutT [Candidatus Uhrbacteria bacterium]HCU31956.1 DNA mismatch repair protein MutT [Candidatus Uhrbacteria bacterium]